MICVRSVEVFENQSFTRHFRMTSSESVVVARTRYLLSTRVYIHLTRYAEVLTFDNRNSPIFLRESLALKFVFVISYFAKVVSLKFHYFNCFRLKFKYICLYELLLLLCFENEVYNFSRRGFCLVISIIKKFLALLAKTFA